MEAIGWIALGLLRFLAILALGVLVALATVLVLGFGIYIFWLS